MAGAITTLLLAPWRALQALANRIAEHVMPNPTGLGDCESESYTGVPCDEWAVTYEEAPGGLDLVAVCGAHARELIDAAVTREVGR